MACKNPFLEAERQPVWVINRIMGGVTRVVSPQLRADALALYDSWWCLRPPERTREPSE